MMRLSSPTCDSVLCPDLDGTSETVNRVSHFENESQMYFYLDNQFRHDT